MSISFYPSVIWSWGTPIGAFLIVGLLSGGGVLDQRDRTRSDESSRFDGTWKVVEDRSSAIDPWKDLTLRIEASDSALFLKRIWKGHYGYSAVDSVRVPVDGKPRSVPQQMWPDNRHVGAFVGKEGEKSVSAKWIDEGKALRVRTRFTAEVSQGEAELRIDSEYRLSPSRNRLVLLELRSTRPKPIRYVFERQGQLGD